MGIGIAALVLGFMALLLTGYWTKKTNDLIKSEDEIAKRLIDEGRKETQRMIDEGNKRAEEGKKETQRMIDSTQRYIASLIAAEGSKTRELIRQR